MDGKTFEIVIYGTDGELSFLTLTEKATQGLVTMLDVGVTMKITRTE